MRKLVLAAAAVLTATCGLASAQGVGGGPNPAGAPMSAKAADDAYLAQCEPKASKALCGCLVSVADSTINDPEERQIFFAYTVGDFERARSQRALFEAEKNMKFNIALQKAERLVHDQCDKLRPQTPPAAAPQPN